MRMRLTRTSCGAALLELSAECHTERERERGGDADSATHKVYVQCKRGSYFDYCFRVCVCGVLGIVLIVLHFWGP